MSVITTESHEKSPENSHEIPRKLDGDVPLKITSSVDSPGPPGPPGHHRLPESLDSHTLAVSRLRRVATQSRVKSPGGSPGPKKTYVVNGRNNGETWYSLVNLISNLQLALVICYFHGRFTCVFAMKNQSLAYLYRHIITMFFREKWN